jgi:phage-related protein
MDEQELRWVASSYKDLTSFPEATRREAGYQLGRVQNGLEPSDWRPMNTIGSGAREIRIQQHGRAHRVIYVAKFAEAVYVLHAFEKKSRKTPQKDIELARCRYKRIASNP